ncbi:hypothetical protein LWC34_45640 [Kibdelosporangium philippinense]|uniref:Uncharacterized protein n=1 Tax=Kibdelosporangium philippinense TaxID=211113 RepID=A0ABS8ZR45_9PSEU|nr:hypothetical protein [Kibdelosporangium philippinense]MCE7010044.1 hypothetical protein [Kibdelosporangium philippinense]
MDQVIAVHDLVATGVSLREAPMVLFASGYPIELESLRAAYLDLFGRLSQAVNTVAPSIKGAALDPGERADAVAVAVVGKVRRGSHLHRWEQRARQSMQHGKKRADVRAFLGGAVSAAMAGLIEGEMASPKGAHEALIVAGLDVVQDPAAVAESLAAIDLHALIDAVASAQTADWVTARQDLQDVLHVAASYQRVEATIRPNNPRLPGLADTSADGTTLYVHIPTLLVLATDEWRTALQQHLTMLEAVERLLADLPAEFHSYLDQQNQGELAIQSASFRHELVARLVAWYEAHPEDARILGLAPPDVALSVPTKSSAIT